MSKAWHVESVACRKRGMSKAWHVESVACRKRGMSKAWHVESMACRKRGMWKEKAWHVERESVACGKTCLEDRILDSLEQFIRQNVAELRRNGLVEFYC